MFDLTGKTALITGATGGIGADIARALHKQGATVGITGRNEDKLKKLADDLKDRVVSLPADLSENSGAQDLIKNAENEMGQIDILVNNAGITRDNLSMRMKDEEWDDVLNVNLTTPFKLAKAVQRGMMKRRWGRIINISSVVGTTGNPGQCNYVAAKAGLIGWTKSMAQEIASRGITVNAVAPGFIATAMTESLTDDQKAKINATIPAGKMGTADDIAAATAFLASEQAQYITGATIHVNGGMAMV